MSEIIDRVAMALCEHESGTFAIDADVYRSRARAAIEAMREPTDGMLADRLAAKSAEIERLQTENLQLKGALGYPVPGHIMPGPFKCGLCEARAGDGK